MILQTLPSVLPLYKLFYIYIIYVYMLLTLFNKCLIPKLSRIEV